ncbi:deoxyribonuclease, TatD family [Deferribacter desulfuricans SSM1]|uniref:Deoxyribonuclease, TatD family n=1 Tax=Deferribacter desulfuricans (strain DSM 14783 / JCM 11476 / NBRC 101012 / SSM1) TaxID=639282 RepID=D3PAF4_DEFDS|nr:TatD family hydrolase [Deferribacter desulfuricans]BAI79577.1 deoxyribonuclease, TatD family [Deferribacter desulfuricans SSM1]
MIDIETQINKLKESGAFFTDSHSHIHFEPLNSNLEEVFKKCKQNRIHRIVNIGINYKDSVKALEIAKKYDFVYAAIGVHPHDSADFNIKELSLFEQLAENEKVIAIGEIGLDYYRNYAPKDIQQNVFRIFLDLAISLQKPIIIHNRDATDDLIKILDEMNAEKKLRGIIHCFNGDKKIMNWALNNDFLISVAGNVTYKKAIEIQESVKEIPIDHLLVETDSPYLAPVPKRGKTNDPSHTIYTANFISQLKDVDIVTLAKQTEKNFTKLFGELNAL